MMDFLPGPYKKLDLMLPVIRPLGQKPDGLTMSIDVAIMNAPKPLFVTVRIH